MVATDFLGGVVEGFYGTAWTHDQRLDLFRRMSALGLNTYLYAPKNDLKHRVIWRECYSDAELDRFRELVRVADSHGVNFVYGLSPGLDIRVSESAERDRIAARFEQLRQIGVRDFALLFDDLPGKISEADHARFTSLAAAQCDVANAALQWAENRIRGGRLLFCPTPYCDRMDRAALGGEGYLDELGGLLDEEIDILWTGPEIISAEVPVESIEHLARRIRRRPVIWDNLFANDYDFSRLHCGPYSGRARELLSVARGILINPNNEYAINYIPLRTLAAFLNGEGRWKAREAFLEAVENWLPAFATAGEPLGLADLVLLCDCFYLPLEEGPEGAKLLELVNRLLSAPAESWGETHQAFNDLNARVQAAFDRLTELWDRELFEAWSRRAWELKEELQIIAAMAARKKAGYDIVTETGLENELPNTFRRGTLARLKSFASRDRRGRLRFHTVDNGNGVA